MPRPNPVGTCRICGNNGELSFEHVPPRAAFNDRPVRSTSFDEGIRLGPDDYATGRIQQRGMGGFTLCRRCNSDTGRWYAAHFVDWCRQGMHILKCSRGKPSLIYVQYVYPLRILKQIVVMFFSINQPSFQTRNAELVRFVLNKEAKYLSPTYRFFVYFNTTGKMRSSNIMALLNVETGVSSIMSEISCPPYGYVMTLDSAPPDERLVEITHFSRHGYYELADINLKLPVLPTHTLVPGDY